MRQEEIQVPRDPDVAQFQQVYTQTDYSDIAHQLYQGDFEMTEWEAEFVWEMTKCKHITPKQGTILKRLERRFL